MAGAGQRGVVSLFCSSRPSALAVAVVVVLSDGQVRLGRKKELAHDAWLLWWLFLRWRNQWRVLAVLGCLGEERMEKQLFLQ